MRPRPIHWLLLLATGLAQATPDSPPTTAPDSTRIDALLAALSRPVPAETRFVEQRDAALLAEPLVLAGTLSHPAPGALVKQVEQPYRERTAIRDGRVELVREGGTRPERRRFSLRHAPELSALLSGFEGVLAGDAALLARHFTPALAGGDDGWRLRLTPRAAALARKLSHLDLHGVGGELRCMVLEEADGDRSRTVVGKSAAALLAAGDASELPPVEAIAGALSQACTTAGTD